MSLKGKRILFVGANPNGHDNHPGGQLTASVGLLDFADENGVNVDIVDTLQSSFPLPAMSTRLKKAANRMWRVFRLCGQRHFDGAIIFSSAGFSFIEKSLLAAICRVRGVPTFFYMVSGHFMETVERGGWRQCLSGWLLRIPTVLGAQGTNWVEVFSSLGRSPDDIVIVRNWLPKSLAVAEQARPIQGPGLVFIFVGWVVEKKGVRELIEAVAGSAQLANDQLLIAGHGDAFAEVEARVEKDRLDHVRLLGWQDPSNIPALYQKADVLVFPSYAEGFPNAVMEAMAEGLAVIATPVGAIADSAIDGRNARLVPVRDHEALRMAMESLSRNHEKVMAYKKQSLEIVRTNHDFDENIRKIFSSLELI